MSSATGPRRRRTAAARRWALVLCAAVLGACCAGPAGAQSKPNIIIFFVDDMGYADSSTYGSGYYETPSLDQLATQGVRFTNAYAACPVCSPTRASLLTGMSSARLHVTDWISGGGDAGKPLSEPAWTKQLRQDRVTIAEALKANGYSTAHIGKWHLGQSGRSEADPTTQGFDVNVGGDHHGSPNSSTGRYFANASGSFGLPGLGNGSSEAGEYLTDRLTTSATDYIAQRAEAGEPFFLHMSHYGVHTPLQGKAELVAKYEAKDPDGGHDNATYAAMLESVDQSLGAIMDALANPDGDSETNDSIVDNTIILFTSDNGGLASITSNDPLRAGKGTKYEGGLRVPLVVKWVGHTTPSSVSDEPVIIWDLYDTILEMTGTDAQAGSSERDGVSLVPVLENTGSRGGALYYHYPHYHGAGAKPFSSIREGDWKLILNYEDDSVELYNLAGDVDESNNLAISNPTKAAELRGKLEQYLISVDAQLPGGTPVTLPGKNMDAAGIISINIGVNAGTSMDPQEFAGVVEENHWNNAVSAGGGAGSGSIADLVDGNGDAAGAGFSFDAGHMSDNNNNATADYRMMNAWGGNKASDTGNTFSVTDLPGEFVTSGYDVYVYFDANSTGANARRISFTIGGVTLFGKEMSSNFNGIYTEADQTGVTDLADAAVGNYVVFRGLHASGFDLVTDAADGTRGPVNGIQIVLVPEPTTLVLLGLGVCLIARRRRRGPGPE